MSDLETQRSLVYSASAEKLYEILASEDAFLKIFKALPHRYAHEFFGTLQTLGLTTKQASVRSAETFVKSSVSLSDLRLAVARVWNPTTLDEGAAALGLSAPQETPFKEILRTAAAMPKAERRKLCVAAGGGRPKVGQPPQGCSPQALPLWNSILRDKKKRKMIMAPKANSDKWALAEKFWLSECARKGTPAYKQDASPSSTSVHGSSTIHRSMKELANGLCYEGYTMSRPAARKMKALWQQLEKDGYDLGRWAPIRPKK